MKLAEYVAAKKRDLFEELSAGRDPSEGRFDAELLKEARVKGKPQIGSSEFQPNLIRLEFIYSSQTGGTIVFSVEIDSPERIVYMAVPEWVVESVWQGEVAGSYQFESDAREMLKAFENTLEEESNKEIFSGPIRKTRESPFG